MDPAGAGCRQAHAQATGELRVSARHERGGFLVSNVDEADLVLALAERFHDAVDAVTWKSEDGVDVPVDEPLDEDVRRGLGCHSDRSDCRSRAERA